MSSLLRRLFSVALVCLAVANVSVAGQNTPTGNTICDRLTTAQGFTLNSTNSYTAVQNLVIRAIVGASASSTVNGVAVTGIYNHPVLAPYFNGQYQTRYPGDPASTIPANGTNQYVSPDFGHSANDLNLLVTRLVTFFGQAAALDCTNALPAYAGSTNLFAVHARMNITQGIFASFNQQIVAALESYGLSTSDGTAVGGVLQNLFGLDNLHPSPMFEICQEAGCKCAAGITGTNCDTAVATSSTGSSGPTGTICDRLTTAQGFTLNSTNSYTAVQNLVVRAIVGASASDTVNGVAVTGIYNHPVLAPYFNGQYQTRYPGDPASTIPSSGPNQYVSPDFGHSASDLNALLLRLVTFFGQAAALDCTNALPAYAGSTNLFAVHARMNITQGIFGAFNAQVVAALESYGLATSDGDALAAVLQGLFGLDNLHASPMFEICQEPGCKCAAGITGTNCDMAAGTSSTGPAGTPSSASTQFQTSFLICIVATVLTIFGMKQH